MADKEEKKLEQTKSQFKLRGIVNRLDNAEIREGETGSGKDYKSIRFSVKTNECEDYINEPFVELFGMVKDKVYTYNQKEKKSLALNFDERNDVPEGYQIIGVRVNWDGDAENLTEWDAVDNIKENLHDGDSVYVSGDVNFNTYTKDGETRTQTQYQIKSISKTKKPIDFEDEKFKEMNSFEKEVVVVSTEKVSEDGNNELHIIGRQINYDEKFVDGVLVIDVSKYKKLATDALKKLKFGDFVKLKGLIWNKADLGQIEQPSDEDDEFGGGEDPTGFNGVTNYTNKLEVTNIDGKTWVKGKYDEDDFQSFIDDGSGEFDDESEDPFSESTESDPWA